MKGKRRSEFMKKFFYVLIIGLLTMIVGCTSKTDSSTTNPPPVGYDNVSGVLRDTNGSPIVGALVKSSWASCTTDASGNWNLGTAPRTINSGNTGEDDQYQEYAISVTMTNVTAPVAGSNYPSVVYRIVAPSTTGENELIVGQKNVTVTGIVQFPNHVPAVGAKVILRYLSAKGTGDDIAGIPVPAVQTVAGGVFTIQNVENGAKIRLEANYAGYSACHLDDTLPATSEAYTYTGEAGLLTLGGLPDQNSAVMVNSPQLSIDGGTSYSTNVGFGDFEPGDFVVKYTFTRGIVPTSYTATTGNIDMGGLNLPTVYTGIDVNVYSKTGNVPFTVSYDLNADFTIAAVKIAFTTGISSVYTVDINSGTTVFKGETIPIGFLSMIGDTSGNPVANADTYVPLVFSTNGGVDLSTKAVGAVTVLGASPSMCRDGGAYDYESGECVFSNTSLNYDAELATDVLDAIAFEWANIAGAKAYVLFFQKIQVFEDGTRSAHPWEQWTGPVYSSQEFEFDKYFYETIGSVGLIYNIKIRAINSDGILGADQLPANWLVLEQDVINAAMGATDFSPRVIWTLYGTPHADHTAFNADGLPLQGFGQDSLILTKSTPKPQGDTISGGFNTDPDTHGKVAEDMYQEARFSAYMTRAQVEDVANWGLIGVDPEATKSVTAVLSTTLSNGVDQTITVTPTIKDVYYNISERTAYITYDLTFAAALTGKNKTCGASTPFSLTAPAFKYLLSGVQDLNGTDLIYINSTGF